MAKQYIRLTAEEHFELHRRALAESLTHAEIVRQILMAYVKNPHALTSPTATHMVSSVLQERLLDQVAVHAERAGITRGQAIRQIVEMALRA